MKEILPRSQAEHDPDATLSNLMFADDILLITGSLMHTATMQDDLTTSTTAYGLQFHSTKILIISNATSTRRRGNTVQGMNIEIFPPEGKAKYFGRFITFKNAVQVEFEHSIKCSWGTFIDVTKVPTERQTQTLRRHSDPITTLRLKHVYDDGRNEEEAPDNATTDDEDDHTDKQKTRRRLSESNEVRSFSRKHSSAGEKRAVVPHPRTPRASTVPPTRQRAGGRHD